MYIYAYIDLALILILYMQPGYIYPDKIFKHLYMIYIYYVGINAIYYVIIYI